tara:strand:+ start:1570 stop:2106 length:537 start_codon:yes stop_codon:yes gene_type:complete
MNYLGKKEGRILVNKKLPKSFNTIQAQNDRRFGDSYERKFKRIIDGWFGCDFQHEKSGWGAIDFINQENKIAVEIKRRRITKGQFYDIMIGYNKYRQARKLMRKGYKVYFFWKFQDRLCFWNVPAILPSYCRVEKGGTYRRGYNETSECLYIPMDKLLDWKDFPTYISYMETNEIINV